MTEPKKEEGTIQLDVGQIDLLDVALPPSSPHAVAEAEARGSKGPPPLPPSLPPAEAKDATPPEEPKIPVPSLPPPPDPTPLPPPAISARKLVGPAQPSGSPIARFLVGMGAASLLCVGGFFALRSLHKPKPAPAPTASAEPAPTHAFTMAPVEITDTPPSASAVPSASAAPTVTATATATATAAAHTSAAPHATAHAPSATPPDDVIKVEN